MLAMLLGCGLRRSELVGLAIEKVQVRQGHWVIVDLIGKGGHIRTIPIPQWVKLGWTVGRQLVESAPGGYSEPLAKMAPFTATDFARTLFGASSVATAGKLG
jgi:integrase